MPAIRGVRSPYVPATFLSLPEPASGRGGRIRHGSSWSTLARAVSSPGRGRNVERYPTGVLQCTGSHPVDHHVAAWLIFVVCATAIVLAGVRLARDGDVIALRTGLGGAWIGAILVAGATSLPEIATAIFAVRVGTASLAVGDLFGSSMANVLLLAVADLTSRQVRVLTRVAINQALVGALAISLTATAAAGILVGHDIALAGIGWAPVMITFGYVTGMRLLHTNRGEPPFSTPEETARAERTAPALRPAIAGFALASVMILVSARFLASSAAEIADQLGISSGFAGVTLLAITTSLPELVVAVAGVRTGAYDLAVGNLLGSNCFNMLIILALDVVDGPGVVLSSVTPDVLVGALFAILLMGQVLLEVLNRSERRIWYIEPGAFFLVLTYLIGLYFTYQAGH